MTPCSSGTKLPVCGYGRLSRTLSAPEPTSARPSLRGTDALAAQACPAVGVARAARPRSAATAHRDADPRHHLFERFGVCSQGENRSPPRWVCCSPPITPTERGDNYSDTGGIAPWLRRRPAHVRSSATRPAADRERATESCGQGSPTEPRPHRRAFSRTWASSRRACCPIARPSQGWLVQQASNGHGVHSRCRGARADRPSRPAPRC